MRACACVCVRARACVCVRACALRVRACLCVCVLVRACACLCVLVRACACLCVLVRACALIGALLSLRAAREVKPEAGAICSLGGGGGNTVPWLQQCPDPLPEAHCPLCKGPFIWTWGLSASFCRMKGSTVSSQRGSHRTCFSGFSGALKPFFGGEIVFLCGTATPCMAD